MILNPTGFAIGTAIDEVYTFGEKEKVQAGGRGTKEWMLEQNTQYAVRLTSDVSSNAGQIILDWYEHTDKD